MESSAEVINDLLDSVVTAYALNSDPDEALENLAFYYQVDRRLLQQVLVDVYYSFIVELTDLDLVRICGDRIDCNVLLKVLIYLAVLNSSSPDELIKIADFDEEDLQHASNIIDCHPGLTCLVKGYISCANRILAGPVC